MTGYELRMMMAATVAAGMWSNARSMDGLLEVSKGDPATVHRLLAADAVEQVDALIRAGGDFDG